MGDPKFEKAFTRDFTLAMLEVWYKGEAHNPKEWSGKIQAYLPYIIFQRVEGTVKSFYDQRGIEWIKNEIKYHLKAHDNFLKRLETNVREKLKLIQPIYEEEKALSKEELLIFIKNFEEAYTWIEAMWWLCHLYDDGELSQLNLSPIIELRKNTDKLSSGTDIVVRKSLAKIFPHIKEYVQVLMIEEIKTGKLPSLEELKKRDAGFFYTENRLYIGATKEFIQKKYAVLLKEEISKEQITIFKGNMANPGKVIGIVQKVMGHKDLSSFKKGEILVSPMTMPDFIVAMEKAAAFITDEGGILCHAAIVAREMKKPCITGTNIATQILHNGDLVEVDADNATIKILKKAKDKLYKL